MRGLKDKRFVVAGGATGIGAAVAKRLTEEGAKVVVGDINTEGLNKTIGEITANGGNAKGVYFDLADAKSADAFITSCVDTYGGVDGLANVGWDISPHYMARDLDLLETPEDVWMRAFECGLLGYNRTMRAVLPHLIKQKNGAIVNITSGAAHIGEPVRGAYATGKLGVHAVTRHVARRWGRDNVRCNAIAPGKVMTGKTKDNFKATIEEGEKLIAGMPLGRSGTPAELAAAVAFLLSDDGAWITGQIWSVDGGQTMRE